MSQRNNYTVPTSWTDEQSAILDVSPAGLWATTPAEPYQRSVSGRISSFDDFAQDSLNYGFPFVHTTYPLPASDERNFHLISQPLLANLHDPRIIQNRSRSAYSNGVGIDSPLNDDSSTPEETFGGWNKDFSAGQYHLPIAENQYESSTYSKGASEEYAATQLSQLSQLSSHVSMLSTIFSPTTDMPYSQYQAGHSVSQAQHDIYPETNKIASTAIKFSHDDVDIPSFSSSNTSRSWSRPLAPAPSFVKPEGETCTGPISESCTSRSFTETHVCDHCNKSFRRASDLRKHCKTHADPDYRPHSCEDCPMKFYYIKDLIRHQVSKHKLKYSSNGHNCASCGRTFIRLDKLQRHQRALHPSDMLESDPEFKLIPDT